MNWIKLTKDNIPSKEVLAVNIVNEFLVGYISEGQENITDFGCEDENTFIDKVTYYCELILPNSK